MRCPDPHTAHDHLTLELECKARPANPSRKKVRRTDPGHLEPHTSIKAREPIPTHATKPVQHTHDEVSAHVPRAR